MTNTDIVQKQLDAYNARNIEDFLALYSDNIRIYDYPKNQLRIVGLQQLRETYKDIFDNSPNLHVQIEKRIVFDNKVIDHEKITGRKSVLPAVTHDNVQRQAGAFTEVVAIYELQNGKIEKVYFIRKHDNK